MAGCGTDHRRVVRAVAKTGQPDVDGARGGEAGQPAPQRAVRRHPAHDRESISPGQGQRTVDAIGDAGDDGLLVGGAEMWAIAIDRLGVDGPKTGRAAPSSAPRRRGSTPPCPASASGTGSGSSRRREPSARSPGRPDSRDRAGVRPCRRPRRQRRRESGRAAEDAVRGHVERAACGRRWRSGRETAAGAAPASR